MPCVTVVPSDRLILVDGEPLHFDFSAPANLRAIQWDGTSGHIEYTDGPNEALTASNATIKSFVDLWQAEKTRVQQAAAATAAAAQAEYDSESARFARLRVERDSRLAATDYLVMPDYPLADKTAVTAYRQALRDLPSQDAAPWDGGGEATPWPAMPAV